MGDLDFWLGTWNCTWDGGTGKTVVTAECGRRVILERFESPELQGRSISIQTDDGLWRQIWADSGGNYIQFEGGRKGDELILRNATHRMRWTDIHPDRMTWFYEKLDGEVLWRIDYAAAA